MKVFRSVITQLSRMPTAIALLIIVALTASSGTVLTQNLQFGTYEESFGPFWAAVFQVLGLYDVYRAPWFLLILALLLISVTSCISRNGPALWQQVWLPKQRSLKWLEKRARQLNEAPSLTGFKQTHDYRRDGAKIKLYQQGLGHRIGYFITHISVILIAIAGLLTATGWRAQLNIAPGMTMTETVSFAEGIPVRQLPFAITLNDFNIDYLPNGQPNRYTSNLMITHPAGATEERTLQVNRPQRVGMHSIFQSSFGDAGSGIRFYFADLVQPAKQDIVTSRIGQTVEYGDISLELVEYHAKIPTPLTLREDQTTPQTINLGAAMDFIYLQPTHAPLQLRAYVDNPRLIGLGDGEGNYFPQPVGIDLSDANQRQIFNQLQQRLDGNVSADDVLAALQDIAGETLADLPPPTRLRFVLQQLQALNVLANVPITAWPIITETKPLQYSALMISYDPGGWLIWPACTFLIIGLFLLQYCRFRQLWRVEQGKQVRWYAYGHCRNGAVPLE